MHQIDSGIKENFFQWQGRLNRRRFFNRLLALTGVSIVLYILMVIVAVAIGADTPDPGSAAQGVFGIFTLLCLPITVSSYMLMIRRLHDIGLSGFFVLLGLVPLISLGFLLYILFKKGTEGENAYGPDPLGVTMPGAESNPYASTLQSEHAPTDIAPPRDQEPRA